MGEETERAARVDLVKSYWAYYVITSADRELADPRRAKNESVPAGDGSRDARTITGKSDDYWWAWAEVEAQVREGEMGAVGLLADLAAGAPDADALTYLGAGPLEELISRHGLALAHALDAATAREPRLAEALNGVSVGVEELDSGVSLVAFFGLSD